mmetsp:Transcript_59485/g.146109  ORF Transcript_59485/g.146109 Transcript_59485/m.146109 type:complete len:283 (-) Transcript_59485:786-1634(-)
MRLIFARHGHAAPVGLVLTRLHAAVKQLLGLVQCRLNVLAACRRVPGRRPFRLVLAGREVAQEQPGALARGRHIGAARQQNGALTRRAVRAHCEKARRVARRALGCGAPKLLAEGSVVLDESTDDAVPCLHDAVADEHLPAETLRFLRGGEEGLLLPLHPALELLDALLPVTRHRLELPHPPRQHAHRLEPPRVLARIGLRRGVRLMALGEGQRLGLGHGALEKVGRVVQGALDVGGVAALGAHPLLQEALSAVQCCLDVFVAQELAPLRGRVACRALDGRR